MHKNLLFVFKNYRALILLGFLMVGGTVTGSEARIKNALGSTKPGPEHKQLAKLEGTYDVAIQVWITRSAKPKAFKATATFEVLLEGRFVKQSVVGAAKQNPLIGHALYGYDRLKSKFSYIWVDNMSTRMNIMAGTSENNGQTIVYKGERPNPMSGDLKQYKNVLTIKEDGTLTVSYYFMKGKKWFKNMEARYTKKKN